MSQHSLARTGIKITHNAGYDAISYCDPHGRIHIRRIGPRNASQYYEWSSNVGYTMTRSAEAKGYRFMGAYVGHSALRPQQTAQTLWDTENIPLSDPRREDWMREVEARATLPRSQWAKVSLNGAYETRGDKRTKMEEAGGKTFWPNEMLPKYVQDCRAGKSKAQQGWSPRTAKDVKALEKAAKA